MRRLNSPERGATAIVVALLLVVLFGFVAIAVDLGAAWSTKKQLQNGADASALAIAQACAEGACGATGSTASSFAALNRTGANGSVVSLDVAHGRVTTRAAITQDYWFAPVLGINSGDIGAEATAGWGAPSGGTTIPLAFSLCEFYWQTGSIIGSPPSTATEFRIDLMTKTSATDDYAVLGVCGTHAAHNEAAGGFGWLDPDPGKCLTSSHTNASGTWVPGDTGVSMPCSIGQPTEPVLIPIFNATNGKNGANAQFKLYSYAAFRITGYCFKNQSDGKWNVGSDNCSKKYLKGYFVKWVSLEDVSFGTNPNLGAQVVRLLD